MTLFFFLSILEDTGYMARVAFVMDKLLRKIGLSGRSFVPMLIGFGCSVPAIMATRTVVLGPGPEDDDSADALHELLGQNPHLRGFFRRLFPDHAALVMIALYVPGIVVGILVALVLKNTAFRGKPVPFVMELPNYRLPSPRAWGCCCGKRPRTFCSGRSP